MATYRRETHVDAPFEDVWAFHSTTAGLEALTPGFMNLRVESVVGPDGDADPEELDAGSRIELSVRPLGIGPRQRVVSVIAAREYGDGAGGVLSLLPILRRPHTRTCGCLPRVQFAN